MDSEKQFEREIRAIIRSKISSKHSEIFSLDSKKAVDILICRDGSAPALFFLEVKFHKARHGRLGFGGRGGVGFQPELLQRKPAYFERNMRWIIGSDSHPNQFLLLKNETIRDYVAGKEIGQKFNNIQKRVFTEETWLSKDQLASKLEQWLTA